MSKINDLKSVMAVLRDDEKGCPWDRKQTFHSLLPHTLEEAYEVLEAVENDDVFVLKDELGDLLFQIIFFARLGEEQALFDFEDIAAGITEKLIRRHPHVFGDAQIANAEAQTHAWEAQKAIERAEQHGQQGTLAGVALALPALTRAAKLQKRAARVGFDWPDIEPVFAKVEEELRETLEEVQQANDPSRIEEEIGDLLFACVNLARHAGVDPETSLRRGNRKFEQRFQHMENNVPANVSALSALSLERWEQLWQQAKQEEHR